MGNRGGISRHAPTLTRVILAATLASAPPAGAKDVLTTCQDICDTITATQCLVTQLRTVAAGSDVDCTTARDIIISGGELWVRDGEFILRGKSLTLQNGGKITADCPQRFVPIGFRVVVANDLTFVASSQAKIRASCEEAGGRVLLEAGGDVTVDALGIDVNGTAADAPGGAVQIDAGGMATVLAEVSADATAGGAAGGSIRVLAPTVDIRAELRAKGYGTGSDEMPGGEIRLEATGDVTVTAGGGLNVGTAKGAGGNIRIHAGGLADLQRPLKAPGTSASRGAGGTVEVFANEIRMNADVTVTGGRRGGSIDLEALAGGLSVGTTGAATLDVTGSTAEAGGRIVLAAGGGSVALGPSATLRASGGTGAEGGRVGIEGEDVTTDGATAIHANGAAPDRGGAIQITARGLMTLDGTIEANNEGSKTFIYKDTVPSIDPGITDYELVQISTL